MTDHFLAECAGGGEVLLLSEHPLVRGAVRDAMSRSGRLHLCGSWDELLDRVREGSPRAVSVVEPFRERPRRTASRAMHDGSRSAGPEIHPALRRLRRDMPSARVLAVVDSDRVEADALIELGRLGVADVLDLRAETTPAAVRARLDAIPADAFRTLLSDSALDDLPGRARLLLERSAELAADGSYPRDLAERLRLDPSSLWRWTRDVGLPAPRDLFRWLRVLLAASLLDDPGRRVEDVARASGYARAAGLRRAMRSVAGEPPSRLREEGAYRTARKGFLDEVRRSRKEAES